MEELDVVKGDVTFLPPRGDVELTSLSAVLYITVYMFMFRSVYIFWLALVSISKISIETIRSVFYSNNHVFLKKLL